MRVLMSGMSGNKGGKETYIFGVSQQLKALGVDIDFMTTDKPMACEKEARALGCQIWRIPPRGKSPFVHARAISRIYTENDYDVIWSHKTTLSSVEDLELAKRSGITVRIIHSHCTDNMGNRLTAVLHMAHRCNIERIATHYFACSKAAGHYFYPAHLPFEIKKNAFNLTEYEPSIEKRQSKRNQLGLKDEFVLGHVGRLSPEKNHERILDIFAEIVRIKPNSVLMLCGIGELREVVLERACSMGVEDKVLMLGARDDIPSLLQAMDLFVFPSIHEGLPYALLEAQAVGIPCIVSTAVPLEAVFGASIQRLSLNDSDYQWASAGLSLVEQGRESAIPAMRADGLDIAIEAKHLFQWLSAELL